MSTTTEALARELTKYGRGFPDGPGLFGEAAAELRRLAQVDAERARWKQWCAEAEARGAAVEAERDQLRAEVEALRADAERYRWLRTVLHGSLGGGVEVNDQKLVYEEPEPDEAVRVFWYPVTPVGFYESKADTLDNAIDWARKG